MTPTEKRLRECLKALVDEIEDLLESDGYLLGNITEPLEAEIEQAKTVLEETREYVIQIHPMAWVNVKDQDGFTTVIERATRMTKLDALSYMERRVDSTVARLVPVDADAPAKEKEHE